MHFTDYQVDRGCLCDKRETAPYQPQHAFALSNSEQSSPLWIHFSDAVVYSILSSVFSSYTISASILRCLLNDLTAVMRLYASTRRIVFPREGSFVHRDSRRTGFEIRLALAKCFEQHCIGF